MGQEDPIGHRITWGLDLPVQWATIIGVVVTGANRRFIDGFYWPKNGDPWIL